MTLREIANYDACVLASRVFTSTTGVFDLNDPTIEYHPSGPPEGGTCPSLAGPPRVISELLVGCWAYDLTRVSAATTLLNVQAADVFDYGGAFVVSCGPDDDYTSCPLGGSFRFGACLGGSCLPRCIKSTDCPSANDGGADTDASNGALDASVGYACTSLPGQPLGVCASQGSNP
jgi:hypothetical protein